MHHNEQNINDNSLLPATSYSQICWKKYVTHNHKKITTQVRLVYINLGPGKLVCNLPLYVQYIAIRRKDNTIVLYTCRADGGCNYNHSVAEV